MITSSCNSAPMKSEPKEKKQKGSRRSWTKEEEVALISVLKEQKGKGLKIDNMFRAGYLQQLEKAIRAILPQTTLHATPQIKSKMTVWKRTYGHLYCMFDSSGHGAWLDEDTKTIQVVSEDWWTEYQRAHPYVEGYRNKVYRYFNDWAEIFGKDRATGNGAEDISAAVSDVLNKEQSQSANGGQASCGNNSTQTGADFVDLEMDEGGGDNGSPSQASPSMTTPKQLLKKIKKEKGLKRPRGPAPIDINTLEVPPYVEELVKKTNETMERIAAQTMEPNIVDDAATTQRKGLYNALLILTDFDEDERIQLLHKLAHSKEDADIFFALPDASRSKYLRVVLQKKVAE